MPLSADPTAVDGRLDHIAATMERATGCDGALIYRRDGHDLVLVAGTGPHRVAFAAVRQGFVDDDEFAEGDFTQVMGPPGSTDALASLGLAYTAAKCFAAAALMLDHDVASGDAASGGVVSGVVIVTSATRQQPFSAAESYLLRAYAEQAATEFEVEALRRAAADGTTHRASVERLRLLESVAVHARDSIVITEAEPLSLPGPRIIYCNQAFTEATGFTADEAIGRTPRILQGPKTDPAVRTRLREAFAGWKPITVELLNYRKDGSEFWVELSIVPVADERGWYTHWVSVQRDITERRQADELDARVRQAEVENEALATEIQERKRVEEELLYTAFHDNLTHLHNRAYFMQRLRTVLDRPGGLAKPCAVLFLDLDRFKVVNDSLGHQAGDVLLNEVARRLERCARTNDTLARLGGDEFALLIEEIDDPRVPVMIAERMLDALRVPVQIGRQEVFPSCSIGVAPSSERASHPEALIRDADIAMYVAKRSGPGEYAVYNESMHADAAATLKLQTDLQLALERDEFEIAYQAIVDPQQGRIKGFEALLRWRHPTRGMVSPIEFIAVAEEIGLIRQIDRWVMRQACAQLAEWRACFADGDLSMSVNTSATEFDDPEFLAELATTLARHALPPRALQLEITEGIFLDPDPRIGEIIAAIRATGVRVALDDFGTGFSSLSYLNRYPTDTIKIDKSFITDLCDDDRTLAIVVLIIQLAKTLGFDVVAEGVETEEQAELLASMSCSHAQGYYFAKPMDAAWVTALLGRTLSLGGGGALADAA